MFKNKLIPLSNIILFTLVILFFNVEYQYSPDVRRNIQFAEFFIENNFNLIELVKYLIDVSSIEFNINISILIYSIGLLIDNLVIFYTKFYYYFVLVLFSKKILMKKNQYFLFLFFLLLLFVKSRFKIVAGFSFI